MNDPAGDLDPAPPAAKPRLSWADAHRLLPLFAVVAGVTVAMLVVMELAGGTERLRAAVESSGIWSPLVYVVLKTVTYVIAPLSGTSIEMASGALFGVWVGTALSVVGSAIGGCINYWIARTLGRKGVSFFGGKKALNQVDAVAGRVGGWRVLLGARLLLAPIYDFISYAAGLARFPFGQYLAITVLGGIPVNIIFPWLGHASATSRTVSYAVLGVLSLAFVVFVAAHFMHSRRQRRP